MGAALGWGALATSSLVLGAFIGLARPWPGRAIGLVLAFGAGALISAVSFELALEGIELAGTRVVAIGLGAGSLTYYVLDNIVERMGGRRAAPSSSESDAGPALALGAFLDGIPEQLVLGIGIAAGGGVSMGLLVAIFVSNLPEAIGSTAEMHATRTSTFIVRLWVAVAVVCIVATVVGYAIADSASDRLKGGINGFAAGALLVMLIDSMIPEARSKAGRTAGLVTTLGFAVAAGLSTVS